MDRYHIALFLHLLALVAAASASAITKLAAARRARARTVGEALEWHDVLAGASKVFPISLAVFVATGSFMLRVGNLQAWASGWVVAGFAGVAFLLAAGVYLAVKGNALRQVLAAMVAHDATRPMPAMTPPALVAALPPMNMGVALAVAFDMATKPASIPVALGVLALGAAIGAATTLRRPATASATAQAA